jgi:hypothetical protein
MLPKMHCIGDHHHRFLRFALSMVGLGIIMIGQPSPAAADVPFVELLHRTGNYGFIAKGVGTRGNPKTGSWNGTGQIVLDIPNTAVIQQASLIWSGRSNQYDPDGVQLSVDSEPAAIVTATKQFAQAPWCCSAQQRHESADITALIQAGSHSYTISDHEHSTAPVGNYLNYGVGIWVVFEDVSEPWGEVIIYEGQDSFFRFWTPPRGPHSEVRCADITPDVIDRYVNTTHLVSGVDAEVDLRSNAFWFMSGIGAKPDPNETPGLIAQPGAIGYIPQSGYPLQSYATLEWDNFSTSGEILVPAGDEWVCFQIESGDSQDLAGLGNLGTPASGMWDLFSIKMSLQPPTAVSLTSFTTRPIGGKEVAVNWESGAEQDHFGFNLYRSVTTEFTDAQLIHFAPPSIPGGNPAGAAYQFIDTVSTIGRWYYWLESVDTEGTTTLYPFQVVNVNGKYYIYVPMLQSN